MIETRISIRIERISKPRASRILLADGAAPDHRAKRCRSEPSSSRDPGHRIGVHFGNPDQIAGSSVWMSRIVGTETAHGGLSHGRRIAPSSRAARDVWSFRANEKSISRVSSLATGKRGLIEFMTIASARARRVVFLFIASANSRSTADVGTARQIGRLIW